MIKHIIKSLLTHYNGKIDAEFFLYLRHSSEIQTAKLPDLDVLAEITPFFFTKVPKWQKYVCSYNFDFVSLIQLRLLELASLRDKSVENGQHY